jgi:hypothetical protein
VDTTKVTTAETPTWTVTTTEKTGAVSNGKITVDQFKQSWGKPENLETMIETNYPWTIATVQWDKVVADIDWKRYEWIIDTRWNPRKTELWIAADIDKKTAQEEKAIAMWVSYKKNSDWSITFNPENVDDLFALGNEFWADMKISKTSSNTIKSSIIYNKIKSKVWLDANSLFEWFKKWEIAPEWATWDYLVKANWWTVTPEMTAAKQQYDTWLDTEEQKRLDNVLFDAMEWKDVSSKDFYSALNTKYQKIYTDQVNQVKDQYKDYKLTFDKYSEWQAETKKLNEKANAIYSELEELSDTRDDIMKNVIKQYPWMSKWAAMLIAKQQTETIDDAIKLKNREYTNAFNNYKFAKETDLETYKAEVETLDRNMAMQKDLSAIAMKNMDTQMWLVTSQFNYNRDRADKLSDYEMARTDQLEDTKSVQDYDTVKWKREQQAISAQFDKEVKAALIKWDDDTANQLKIMQRKYENDSKMLLQEWKSVVKYDTNGNPIATVSGWNNTLVYSTWNENVDNYLNAPEWAQLPWTNYPNLWKWLQCWEYVRKITWKSYWDSMQSKLNNMDIQFGYNYNIKWASLLKDVAQSSSNFNFQPWQVVVWDAWNKENWHIWVVTWIDANWNPIVKSSNLKWDTKITEEAVPKNKILWVQKNAVKMKITDKMWVDSSSYESAKIAAISAKKWDAKALNDLSWETRNVANYMLDRFNSVERNSAAAKLFKNLTTSDTKASNAEQVAKYQTAMEERALSGDYTDLNKSIKNILNKDNQDIWTLYATIKTADTLKWVVNSLNKTTWTTWLATAVEEKFARMIWNSSWKEITKISQISEKMLAEYMKKISWAAVSDWEVKRLKKILPDIKQNPQLFLQTLDTFISGTARDTMWATLSRLWWDESAMLEIYPEFAPYFN